MEAKLCGPKDRGWLMRWLPARAHGNGVFLVFGNSVGADDGEIRTVKTTILDSYRRILSGTRQVGDGMVVTDLDASLLEVSTSRRRSKTRRPE
jgi:hypothetical protein